MDNNDDFDFNADLTHALDELIDIPELDIPYNEISDIEMPHLDMPNIDLPDLEMPDIDLSENGINDILNQFDIKTIDAFTPINQIEERFVTLCDKALKFMKNEGE